ncbi:FeoA family protein [Parasphingorhabdus flavimaris]|jgi:ferrous iron transport protein A|uniref:Ferrous iron transport protein A n=1 Tax=Parasphingorhabdus flavimaris TaxID=266812 RepID=A0ABX2MYL1_9SPHN|nr:FeoA family protein [Parasphingorhabdus flavimaris]NVD26488.1 ferrous iron transport protein A [Parasphingorhabdus flavimaris]|tara:strand:+ start:11334 stop:11603 length:270 start_codon:yes stop_codon:yes gene_type:complete
MSIATTLDQLSLKQNAEIVAIDWAAISESEGRRLRALGIDEGIAVEKLHKGMFGLNDPIALKVGRMMIAVRKSHAQAISVALIPVTIPA